VVVNENIPGRRRLLRREAIAINQFRKAIVVHRPCVLLDSAENMVAHLAGRGRGGSRAACREKRKPQHCLRGIRYRILASAQLNGYQWVFIDTAPTTWLVVKEAIRAATPVLIPVRPGFFDLAAVRETVATARELGKPYAVVINAAR
jgi:hypothetical protein